MKEAMNLCGRAQQTGSVLVVALVILLILTLLGLSGMNTTILQERMAGNLQDMNSAFQAAEAGLRDGEADVLANIDDSSTFTVTCSSGRCEPASLSDGEDVWEDTAKVNWDTGTNTITYGDNTSPTPASIPLVHEQPRYVIERLQVVGAGSSLTFKGYGEAPTFWYRVTTAGFGVQPQEVGQGQVLLQSVFRK